MKKLMKEIARLTDESVLGLAGTSNSLCKYKVRAVVKNLNGQYALMFEERTGLYSFPGGSVEEGEDFLSALKREIMEETGCTCDELSELGYIYENRAYCDLQQYSFYYSVRSKNPSQSARLTNEEIQAGTRLLWCNLSEVINLIDNQNPQTNQQRYLYARDKAALKEYLLCLCNTRVE